MSERAIGMHKRAGHTVGIEKVKIRDYSAVEYSHKSEFHKNLQTKKRTRLQCIFMEASKSARWGDMLKCIYI